MTEISNVVFAAVLLFSVSCDSGPLAPNSGTDAGGSQAEAAQLNAECERIRKDPTDYQQLEEYDRYLLPALYLMSANAKDRAGLIYFFSGKCPRFVANSAIELEVASLDIPQPLMG